MANTNQLYQQIAQNLRANIPEDPDLLYYLITLDYGIHTTDAIVRWCGKTIETLRDQDSGSDSDIHEDTCRKSLTTES